MQTVGEEAGVHGDYLVGIVDLVGHTGYQSTEGSQLVGSKQLLLLGLQESLRFLALRYISNNDDVRRCVLPNGSRPRDLYRNDPARAVHEATLIALRSGSAIYPHREPSLHLNSLVRSYEIAEAFPSKLLRLVPGDFRGFRVGIDH